MKLDLRKLLIVTGLSVLAINSNAGDFSGALNKAHAAFLNKDFKKMASEMKSALTENSNDPLIRENVLGLLKKAYDVSGSNGIPVDWHLPDEILKMRVAVSLRQKEIPEYALRISGSTSQIHIIKQLQVVKYPDQVIMDKEAGIGEWEEEPPQNGDDAEYSLQSKKSRQPASTGLYLLNLELTNGKTVSGWFLVDDEMNATAAPDISAPAVGEVFHTGNPTLRWLDFRSPQYKPYERRSIWIGVSRNEPPNYDWDQKWDLWQDSPTIQEATVGITPEGRGATRLDNGHYVFVVNYHERRRFGDIMIGRDCVTVRSFTVQQ